MVNCLFDFKMVIFLIYTVFALCCRSSTILIFPYVPYMIHMHVEDTIVVNLCILFSFLFFPEFVFFFFLKLSGMNFACAQFKYIVESVCTPSLTLLHLKQYLVCLNMKNR